MMAAPGGAALAMAACGNDDGERERAGRGALADKQAMRSIKR
ncbi:hypothetical protein [Roseixanthobacter glucoisosaccharinicivorans]